jgi:predicted RNase H-like HicB family nuclease
MEESVISKSAYDLVYEAPRPEIFFKATPSRCRATGQPLRLRDDTKWIVPEPELALVISAHGQIVGYTIGNDMSCPDIEGENLLYLPQAKTYHRSCALGPWITLGTPEAAAREWKIKISHTKAQTTKNNEEDEIGFGKQDKQAHMQSFLIAQCEVNIWWSGEDRAYVAEAAELPGCLAHGKTREAALANLNDAMRMWIKTAREDGAEVPELSDTMPSIAPLAACD